MRRTALLWITALVLGWMFDFLFWGHAPGINFAIYVLLCLAGGFLVLYLNGLKPSWKTALLLVPVLFFAGMTFLRQEPMSLFLATAFTLGSMGLMAISFLSGRWYRYSLSDYVVNGLRLAGSMIARPFIFYAENRKSIPADASTDKKRTGRRVWAVLRGVLIAIPILAVFAALLSSADLVFAQRLQEFVALFNLENLPQYIFRAIYILIGAYALAGVFLHAAQKSQDEKLFGVDKPLVAPFLGFTEAVIVLGAVILLFALFAVIQFRYFFGGQVNIGIQGYTYAEYARKGFSELVTVAFFSLVLFIGLSGIVKRQGSIQRWTFSGLGLGMVALVGVMLLSAYQRLLLYEAAYGFSRLRMYTHVFMIWLGALLAAVVVLDLLRRERMFAQAILAASIGFAATLNLVNVDGFIAQQNVLRSAGGQELDAAYLSSLSTDAVPVLVADFKDPSLDAASRDAVGAALACRGQRSTVTGDADWRSFTITRMRAEQALAAVQHELDQYQVIDEEWPVRILTPGGTTLECYDSGGM